MKAKELAVSGQVKNGDYTHAPIVGVIAGLQQLACEPLC
jgi:hypothetical protein